MTWLLLLFLVPGYIVSRHHLPVKFIARQETGHTQYFRIVEISLRLFLINSAILYLASVTPGFGWAIEKLIDFLNSLPILREMIPEARQDSFGYLSLNFLLSYCYAYDMKYSASRADRNTTVKHYESALEDNEFENLLLQAAKRGLPVSITLKNDKTYIGLVQRTNFHSVERKHLALLPLLSGYRDPEKKTLELTTRYTDIYDRLSCMKEPDVSEKDFKMVFAIDEIVNANLFSLRVYNMLHSGGQSTDGKSAS